MCVFLYLVSNRLCPSAGLVVCMAPLCMSLRGLRLHCVVLTSNTHRTVNSNRRIVWNALCLRKHLKTYEHQSWRYSFHLASSEEAMVISSLEFKRRSLLWYFHTFREELHASGDQWMMKKLWEAQSNTPTPRWWIHHENNLDVDRYFDSRIEADGHVSTFVCQVGSTLH